MERVFVFSGNLNVAFLVLRPLGPGVWAREEGG